MRHVAESLAGRAVFLDLEGFSLAELASIEAHASWFRDWLQNPEAYSSSKHPRLSLPANAYELIWCGCLQARFAQAEGVFADTGLACSAQAISSPTTLGGHPLWSPLFETFVAGELRKQMALLSPPPKLYHWRSNDSAEVDFLLERDGRFFPIEVKAKRRPTRVDTRGLQAFRAAHPQLKIAPGLVVAPTEAMDRLNEDDIAIPWDAG